MTQRVSDKIIATFTRQQHDWMERVLKGSLDPVKVARAVQVIIDEGNNNRSNNFILPTEIDPATFIGKGWKWADTYVDARSLALPRVDFSKVLFETCLEEGEARITGKEKLHRLLDKDDIRLDPRFGVTLFKEEGQKTLKRLCEERGITHLDFPGRVLVNRAGEHCLFYLYLHSDDTWGCGADNLALNCDSRHPSAVLAKTKTNIPLESNLSFTR